MYIQYSILILVLLTLFSPLYANEYRFEEIAKHNNTDSCWIVIDSNVYDVTNYIKDHPAPQIIMKKACGTDASKDFGDKKGMGKEHSEKAKEQRVKFLIGILKK